jgi:hypothetical protein
MKTLVGALAGLVLCSSLTGCGGASADDDDTGPGSLAEALVVVRFHDSSVPPPYHRSWEVTVTPDEATMVVTSYSNELARRTVAVSEQDRAAFLADLPDALEEVGTEDAGETCPGGTTTELEVDDAGDLDRHVTAAPSCDDDPHPGEVADAIEELVAPFRDDLGLDEAIRTR